MPSANDQGYSYFVESAQVNGGAPVYIPALSGFGGGTDLSVMLSTQTAYGCPNNGAGYTQFWTDATGSQMEQNLGCVAQGDESYGWYIFESPKSPSRDTTGSFVAPDGSHLCQIPVFYPKSLNILDAEIGQYVNGQGAVAINSNHKSHTGLQYVSQSAWTFPPRRFRPMEILSPKVTLAVTKLSPTL